MTYSLTDIISGAVITIICYAVFPLLYAAFRKKPVTAKRYGITSYAVNFIIMMLFFKIPLFIGTGSSSGYVVNTTPWLIWSSVFIWLGRKILDRKGILIRKDKAAAEQNSSEPKPDMQETENTEADSNDAVHPKESLDAEPDKEIPEAIPIRFHIPYAVLAVLLIASVFLNIVQYRAGIGRTVSSDKAETEETTAQESMDETAEQESGYYELIKREVSNGSVGYASEDFHANTGIVFMNVDSDSKRIILETGTGEDASITVSCDGSSADVSFDESSWSEDWTTCTITPHEAGVTAATFSTTVNNESFKVIIIVE